MNYYGYGYDFFSPFHFVFSVLGWFIIIVFIIWLVRRSHRKEYLKEHWMKGARGIFHDPAMDTLRERYAKGEINKEEFETKKKDLELK